MALMKVVTVTGMPGGMSPDRRSRRSWRGRTIRGGAVPSGAEVETLRPASVVRVVHRGCRRQSRLVRSDSPGSVQGLPVRDDEAGLVDRDAAGHDRCAAVAAPAGRQADGDGPADVGDSGGL